MKLATILALALALAAMPMSSALAQQEARTSRDQSIAVDVDAVAPALGTQGRVLVLGRIGVPTGQIIMPDRDVGYHLDTASLALDPDNRRILVVAGDRNDGRGAFIFEAEGFAPGASPYSLE